MADDPGSRRLALHDALTGRGFSRVPSGEGDHYSGWLNVQPEKVSVTVSVFDLDFVSLPTIVIDPAWEPPQRKLPHVMGPGGALCYYAQGSVILDRYDPAGTIIQCIERAERVLQDALSGRLDEDFAEEFSVYWTESYLLYDLPKDFLGWGEIRHVHLGNLQGTTPVLTTGASWAYQRSNSSSNSEPIPVWIVAVDQALTINPKMAWPPSNYVAMQEWLNWIDPSLTKALETALTKGTLPEAYLAIRASNGLFVLRIHVPPSLQKPEFLTNRRSSLPDVLSRAGTTVRVERSVGDAADLEYIYGRNLGSKAGLAGKSILVVGCGTIGAFLAQQLAQCGAGTGGGRLVLLDSQTLQTPNLGRHLLGVPFLHANKAIGCADFLNWTLPGANVKGIAGNAMLFDGYQLFDLVIDATGEEALSLALNQKSVVARPKSPPHVYVWLMGNGALAQAILVDNDQTRACLKCLKPTLSGEPRFRSLRPEIKVEIGSIAACGDAEFTPFPVSRSVSAAAIACDLVVDWANGNVGDRFRSQTFDHTAAFRISNSSPSPHSDCPACRTRH